MKRFSVPASLSNAAPLIRDAMAALVAFLLAFIPSVVLNLAGDFFIRYGMAPAVPLALRALQVVLLVAGISIIAASALRITLATVAGADLATDSASSFVKFLGNRIRRGGTDARSQPASPTDKLQAGLLLTWNVVRPAIENGDFEEGLAGWGTGFFESQFASPSGAALMFNEAVATWSIDTRKAHHGTHALRIEHSSTNSPHTFSSLSQRIKVLPARRYEIRFWAYLEATDGRGAFSLRVLPSRRLRPGEWDKFKKKIDPAIVGEWQEVLCPFDSGSDAFFDIRFVCETAMRLWLDDVSIAMLAEDT